MQAYIVLYRIESIMSPMDSPFGFPCWADDSDHAEEQCSNAYPDSNVVWVYQGDPELGMMPALQDYWNNGSEFILEPTSEPIH